MIDPAAARLASGIWARLAQGAADRGSALRTPVLATTGPDGRPEARVLVLREVDTATRRLRFFTDARTAKCAALAERPSAALCFWEPAQQLQLRLDGAAQVIATGPAHAAAWSAIAMRAGRDYGAEPPPGAPLAGPDSWRAPESPSMGAAAFRLLDVTVARLDVLELRRDGHRRAQLCWNADGALIRAHWVTP